MPVKISSILKPFFIGSGAFILTFMVMMGTSPLVTAIFTVLLYFPLGVWVGKMQPHSLWYAPLLMNILIWVIFIPMGVEFWPPIIRIWYFLVPPFAALIAAYAGTYVSYLVNKKNVRHFPQAKRFVGYILLFFLGVAAMFVCHSLLFLSVYFLKFSFGAGYALSYLLVYPALAIILALRHHFRWLASGVVICLAPLLYWFFLLWSDGKLSLSGISFSNSTIMMVIMPLTFALSCIAAFVVNKPQKEMKKFYGKKKTSL